ncbi:MAG: bifunctional UDP-N-acetylglucosamine diphosphorylase/glucosamine-1-phosphate N-acetyltransferase GlmU [Synergistales bacterium]|nr:bifunctional UDP-N-acetylglucosamine diphosphorylase/glucosamine-1-phosphate N-acetyltransferase GlmU [Synergistales bacterium]
MSVNNSICSLVLAAGKGTRMKTSLPKTMHKIIDQPMLFYPLAVLGNCGLSNSSVVIGHGGDTVREYLDLSWPGINVVWQNEQKGTGHAVMVAEYWWSRFDNVLVLPGDVPLISTDTINALIRSHIQTGSALSFLSFSPSNTVGYGRVIRSREGIRIVEEKDATEEEKKVTEVNSGIFVFGTSWLQTALLNLSNANSQEEYYLTDTLKEIQFRQGIVNVLHSDDTQEFEGVNTLHQLAEVTSFMQQRILMDWMAEGVMMADPESVRIGPLVTLSRDVEIEPFVQLSGQTTIEEGVKIGSFTLIQNSSVGKQSRILSHSMIIDSQVGQYATVGPFSFIRDHSVIDDRTFVGKFVEIKNSTVGTSSKVPHLSYIGDAVIGADTNIGAGTITCNYDGKKKNATHIGDRCFIGSDTMLVAPVNVEDDSYTGAGSVITKDVPSGSLAVARARQKNLKDWVLKKKKDKE